MGAALAILLLFSPLWFLLLGGLFADMWADADADKFSRYVRLTWADKHPEEPY